MGLLNASVGKGGVNNKEDVQLIEFLLNRVLHLIYPPSAGVHDGKLVFEEALSAIPIDGKIDDVVVNTIKDFQRNILGFKWPDGRVDPGKNSIRALARIFAEQGGVTAVGPTEVKALADPTASFHRQYGAAYQTGVYSSGQLVAGYDGTRLILNINAHETVFLLLDDEGPGDEVKDMNPMRGKPGTVYRQNTAAFFDERDGMFFNKLSKRLELAKKLIELELGIMIALVSATSTAGFVAVLGISGFQFVLENHEKFPKWAAAVGALISARMTLKKCTPTLYEKLSEGLFIGVKASVLTSMGFLGPDVIGNIPSAMVKDPMTTGKLIGALIANVGKATLVKRMTAFGVVFAILKTIAIKAATGIPGAIGLTIPEKIKSAKEIVQHLQSIGVKITEQEASKIVDEVAKNGRELARAMEDLANAFRQF